MNIFAPNIIICLVLIHVRGQSDKLVSEEVYSSEYNKKQESNKMAVNHRRANEDNSDELWHISHLKNMKFDTRKSICKDESFDDKVKRYRKALRNDGGRVEFVSAYALPVDESDMKGEKCEELRDDKLKLKETRLNPIGTKETVSIKDVKDKELSEGKPEVVNTATTAEANASVKHPKIDNKDENVRRAGDYMFSSEEYYDEVVDFDPAMCPVDVDVITLEQEVIAKYDIECELMIEWRSMD